MMARLWRVLKWLVGIIILAAIGLAIMFMLAVGPGNFGRLVLGIGARYDETPPQLPTELPGPAILIFSKTNGFRDDAQIAAANRALEEIARQRGWSSYTTENAAVFNPAQLSRFKAVVWNSVSGDVLTPQQRDAFRTWLEKAGASSVCMGLAAIRNMPGAGMWTTSSARSSSAISWTRNSRRRT